MRLWVPMMLVLAACLATLPVWSDAADTSRNEVIFADIDTLTFAGGELRGLTWLAPDTLVALMAVADTLPELPELDVKLVWIDNQGEVFREEDFTGTLSRGLVFDGKYLWSLGDERGEVPAMLYKIESDTLFVEGAYPTPGHRPVDLTFDGTDIWLVDRDRGRLDKFSVKDEEVTRSFTTPAFSPCGVAFDGRFFWITDSGTGRAYRVSRSGRTWSGIVRMDAFYYRGREIRLIWDGEDLWRICEQDSSAYKFIVN